MEYSNALSFNYKLLGYELIGFGALLSYMSNGRIGEELLVVGPVMLVSAYGMDLIKKHYNFHNA